MQRVIAYIDGFNLFFGLRDKGWRRYYWLDPAALAGNLLKPGQQLVETNYFTARISANRRDPDKHVRQQTYLEAIEATPGILTHYGHYLTKTKECLRCHATWSLHEEKMTDVQIAVKLLTDAIDDRYDTALLVSADSDLTPPVAAVKARFPDKRIVMVCPPQRQSKRLEAECHACLRLGRKTLQDSQFADQVKKADGFVLTRPAAWV